MLNPSKMLRSFIYAFSGVKWIFRENNTHFHLLASVLVLFLGFYLQISYPEWLAVILSIGLVWACEGFNTAIEHLCDALSPEKNEAIGRVKDIAAGAVLLAAIAALMVGILVFSPKLYVLQIVL